MVSAYVYFTELPDGINEMVTPCFDGYTVYIESRLPKNKQFKALQHACEHIVNNDFEESDVQIIEETAHDT